MLLLGRLLLEARLARKEAEQRLLVKGGQGKTHKHLACGPILEDATTSAQGEALLRGCDVDGWCLYSYMAASSWMR